MKSNEVFLRHILDEIDFLLDRAESLTFEKFVSNEVMKRACTRSFEIMGEAVKNLPSDFKKKHKDVERKSCPAFGARSPVCWNKRRGRVSRQLLFPSGDRPTRLLKLGGWKEVGGRYES